MLKPYAFQEEDILWLSGKNATAYLLGAFLSDGYLSWRLASPHPVWQIKDEDFAVRIAKCLQRCGSSVGFYDYRENRGTFYVTELAKGSFGRWLWRVSGEKERLPKVPRDLIPELVAGVLDGDGCMSKKSEFRST